MPRASVCHACGVPRPGVSWSCPACGARSRLRPSRCAWIVLAVVLALAGVAGMFLVGWMRQNPLIEGVKAMAGGHKYGAGGRGTDAIVQVHNTNDVPVDVTIRAEGKDEGGNVVISEPLRPMKGLEPGELRTLPFHWEISPLKSIDYQVIDAQPKGGSDEP